MDSSLGKESIIKEIIGQRYAQGVRQSLRQMGLNFTERQMQSDELEAPHTLFEIHLPQQVSSKTNQFYFKLFKRFYDLRKIINPQLTFETFLSQYNHQINLKTQNYKLQDIVDPPIASHCLNSLIVQKQLAYAKSETIQLLLDKKQEIEQLQSQSQQVNKQYNQLVNTLIEKNVQINLQNLEYQLRLKEHQISQKQKATKIYLPSSVLQKKPPTKESERNISNNSLMNEEKRQEVERIKVVIGNNMWGWGDKIQERLRKLKQLQQEVHQA